MIDYKTILGFIAVSIVIVSFFPYIRHVLKDRTKPHAFSWLIWASLTGIGFSAQLLEGGGTGAWANAVNSLLCGVVFILALMRGDRRFTKFDWSILMLAVLALVLWAFTGEAVVAVLLVTFADCIAYLPTWHKSYHKPNEETLSIFIASSLHQAISIVALQTYTLATWLYPATLCLFNIVFVVTIAIRRRQLAHKLKTL